MRTSPSLSRSSELLLLFEATSHDDRVPDRQAYLAACEALGVRPSEVLHVGDRHDLDVLAPRRIGMDAVYLDCVDRGPVSEKARIEDLHDLVRFLREVPT